MTECPPSGVECGADMARLDLRLPDETKTRVEEEAARYGDSVSGFVRQSIAFYLAWLAAERGDDPPQDMPERMKPR